MAVGPCAMSRGCRQGQGGGLSCPACTARTIRLCCIQARCVASYTDSGETVSPLIGRDPVLSVALTDAGSLSVLCAQCKQSAAVVRTYSVQPGVAQIGVNTSTHAEMAGDTYLIGQSSDNTACAASLGANIKIQVAHAGPAPLLGQQPC